MTLVNREGERLVKVAVLTPCQDQVCAGFAHDLARLTGSYPNLLLFQSRGTIIPQQRATLANAAMKAGATHCLWIDSDMRFPPDALHRLLSHDEPIVGCNYSTRRSPIIPTAETAFGPLYSDTEGLVEVTQAGFGLMLIDCDVFRKMGEPYFALGFNPKEKCYIGEDFFFCDKARKHGYRILIDQELSKEVRHIGEMEIGYEHANILRAASVVQ